MTAARGLYLTTKDLIPISVDSMGRVQVSGSSAAVTYVSSPTAGHVHTQSLTSAGLHYVATPAAGALNTKSLTSAALHYVATPAAGSVNVKSVTSAGLVYVATQSAGSLSVKSNTSTGLVYCATPTSAGLTVKMKYKLSTASFTSGYRIAGTSVAATSTNITTGLYRVVANGNTFWLRMGATASITTKGYVMSEGTAEYLYIAGTKLSTICTSAAGALYLTKMS